jgi:hypothetical protein
MALPGQQAALEALRWNWDEAYHIGCDEGLWWYRRRDGKGATETATTPDHLHTQIITDYFTFPVNREALPPSPAQPAPTAPCFCWADTPFSHRPPTPLAATADAIGALVSPAHTPQQDTPQ